MHSMGRAPFQFILPGGQLSGEPGHITLDDMVGNNILKHIHPEQGDLVQNNTLVRNGTSHHDIEGAHTVGRHDEQGFIVHRINIADLATGNQRTGTDFSTCYNFHEKPRGMKKPEQWISASMVSGNPPDKELYE